MKILALLIFCLAAEDWPEWRGKGRKGVWTEDGIVDRFSEDGLKIRWRAPVHTGFAGPAVAAGRVFVVDWDHKQGNRGIERAMALDEKTGKALWTREWEAQYIGLQPIYATGPRATPTVDGDRLYVLGAMGALHCLNTATGEVIWSRDFVRDFKTHVPIWGITAAPIVDGNRLICLAGGETAKIIALDKMTGNEIWRALDADSEIGYSPPVLVEAGGRRQLIQWHATAVTSLDPENGRVWWQQPWKMNVGLNVGTPVLTPSRLFFSAFYNGPMMLELDGSKPAARILWKGSSESEIKTDGLHSLISTPVLDGDYIYGICSYGQLRCLNAKTGERVWETLEVTRENARWATGHIVRHKNRYFINNDRGELIIANLSPKGYEEISRTFLIKPTTRPGNRRQREFINWTHPAYANRHIVTRNDEEIISASLAR
ncbi:MAG: PQQ-like beta-propeller repeat protein [Acidobacteria bacterium]|nr:PQQ-like beta-propeller repeat protein [Acidobacteriota bacterium]